MSKRRSGQKLLFYDLEGQGSRLQVMAMMDKHRPFARTRLFGILCNTNELILFSREQIISRGTVQVCAPRFATKRGSRWFVSCKKVFFNSLFSMNLRCEVVEGYPARTKPGELSIVPLSIELVAPCMHQLPEPNSFTNPVFFHQLVKFKNIKFTENIPGIKAKKEAC